MVALAKDRNTASREATDFVHPVAAAAKIFTGSIVMLNAAGDAVPASAASELTIAGVAQEQGDNSGGAAGDLTVKVRKGAFRFENGDAIVAADVGEMAYADDDQTVFKAAAGRSPVGLIIEVDSDGVWVHIPPRLTPDAANPDTSSGVIATVETEVNELKATLRRAGYIST